MVNEKKNGINRISKDRVVIGLDLSDEFSQISYASLSDSEPQTISLVLGGTQMCIPTKLAKSYIDNTWTFGKDAEELEKSGEGTVLSNLVELARKKELVSVDGRDYDPADILALFIKKCFSLLAVTAPIEKVSIIVITVDTPDSLMIEILSKAIETLRIKPEKVFFQGHSESVYNFIIHQKEELWNHDVLVAHVTKEGLHLRTVKKNINATPIVVIMEETVDTRIKMSDLENATDSIKKKLDQYFYMDVRGICEKDFVSSVYLIGNAFEDKWYTDTLKYLCKSRHVFAGNNMYSKGACYGAREKLESSVEGQRHVFLGKDKVKANIGMNVMLGGEESYMPLLDAGNNWFEMNRELELILDHEDVINIIVTPLDGKNMKTIPVFLTGCPVRPSKATRIHVEMKMLSESRLYICITDMGFGEFFPPSGMFWKNEITLE